MLLLVGCGPAQQQELIAGEDEEVPSPPSPPPAPSSPGLAGQAYAAGGVCYTEAQLGRMFSPSDIIIVNEPVTIGSDLRVDVSNNHYIFRKGKLFKNCGRWEDFDYSPTATGRLSGPWIRPTNNQDLASPAATYSIPVTADFSTEGPHYVLAYGCRREGGGWNCHNRKWMVLSFRVTPTCNDGVRNQDESDVDCGGACGATCAADQLCRADNDCASDLCDNGVCVELGEEGPGEEFCVPEAEICDGQDNDCDEVVDNENGEELCPAGEGCENGACVAPPAAAVEVCGWTNWEVCRDRGQQSPYCPQSDRCCGPEEPRFDLLVNEGCDGSTYFNESRTAACGVIRFEEDCSQKLGGHVCRIDLPHQNQGCVGELGARCTSEHGDCISGLCGQNDAGQFVCEEPNQPAGSACQYDRECASNLCGVGDAGQFVCEEPNQPAGARCESWLEGGRECASGRCSLVGANQYTCEGSNQPAGSACRYGRECASGRCRNNLCT